MLVLFGFCGTAWAKDFRVVVLPAQDWTARSPFVPPGRSVQNESQDIRKVRARVVDELGRAIGVVIVKPHMSNTQPSTEELLLRGFLQLGIEFYRNLQSDKAKETLKRGLKLALSFNVWAWKPALLSRFYFYLGLCSIDLKQPMEAYGYFRKVFMLNPAMKVQKGYYPEPVEKAIAVAFKDVVTSMEHPVDSPAGFSLSAFMKKERANAVVMVYARIKDGQRMFGIAIIDPDIKDGRFQRDFPATEGVSDSVSAMVEAYLACAHLPWKRPPTKKWSNRIFMDTTGVYQFYAK